MIEVHFGGRARVGSTMVRGGDKRFTASREKLVLNCFRAYEFTPEQVVAIVPDGPGWMASGIRIRHNRRDCPGRVYFTASDLSSKQLVAAIAETGFVPKGAKLGFGERSFFHSPFRVAFALMAVMAVFFLTRQYFQ